MDEKSYIDPRVAKGRAKLFSEDVSCTPSANIFSAFLQRATSRWRSGVSGREAYKFMERVLKPAADPYVWSYPLHRTPVYTIFRGFFEQRRADGGIDVFFLQCSSALPPSMALVLKIEVTEHALQRAIQRIGSTDASLLRLQLQRAFTTFPLILNCVEQDGWRQLGLACEEGIFVGGFEDGSYMIRTFIPSTDNGRPSPWRDIHAQLWSNYDEWTRFEVASGPQPAVGFDDLLNSLPVQYPFLLKPYERKADHLDDAWANRP